MSIFVPKNKLEQTSYDDYTKENNMSDKTEYNANFLWPHEEGSIDEAGYEFANAKTEAYQRQWWITLLFRITEAAVEAKNQE